MCDIYWKTCIAGKVITFFEKCKREIIDNIWELRCRNNKKEIISMEGYYLCVCTYAFKANLKNKRGYLYEEK